MPQKDLKNECKKPELVILFEKLADENKEVKLPIRKPSIAKVNKCQSWPKVDELRAKFEMKKITEKPDEKHKMLDEKAIENYDEKKK